LRRNDENYNVAVYGTGSMGTGIISLILRKKSEIAFLPGREHFPEIKKFIKREKSKANFFLKEKSTQWENILQKLLLRARMFF